MSARALRMLAWAVAVLAAVWGIVTLVSSSRRRDDGPRSLLALSAFFEGATETSVSEVRLTGPRDTVSLRRQSRGMWTANGYRADSGAVARFWQAMDSSAVGAVVATNPSNHERLGFAPDSVWRVEVDVDGTTRVVLVGRKGLEAGTTFVRFPASDTVYLVQSDLHVRVAHSTDDWRDRHVLSVDTSAVARIGIELDGDRYDLVRPRGAWAFAGGAKADTTVARIILTELKYLHAAGFLEQGDPIARKPRGGHVIALSAAGDTLARLTLGAAGGDRWARTRGDSTLYRLADYRVERVAPTRKQLQGRR